MLPWLSRRTSALVEFLGVPIIPSRFQPLPSLPPALSIENGRLMKDVVFDVGDAGVGDVGICFDRRAARLRAMSFAANFARF